MLHDTGGGGGGEGEGGRGTERERRRERGRIYMVAEHSRVLNAMQDGIMHVYMMATKYNLATSSGAVATSLEEVTGETKIAM